MYRISSFLFTVSSFVSPLSWSVIDEVARYRISELRYSSAGFSTDLRFRLRLNFYFLWNLVHEYEFRQTGQQTD